MNTTPKNLAMTLTGAAKTTLIATTGWQFGGDATVLFWVLVFTAVYNALNLLVASILPGLIVSPLTNSFRHVASLETWLIRSLVRGRPVK